MSTPVLVTGAAGFIGMHVAQRLLERGERVVGVDNYNDYYDPGLKEARAAELSQHTAFEMVRGDIADHAMIGALVKQHGVKRIVHGCEASGCDSRPEGPRADHGISPPLRA